MCGFCGFLDTRHQYFSDARSIIGKMNQKLARRGPDDHGVWLGEKHGLALGHRRLSILDASSHAKQPMSDASGRYQLVFNGEIYNHQALRNQLPNDLPYTSHSDTQTLFFALQLWGVEKTLQKLTGMFAFCWLDCTKQTLTLVRDRAGEKPLYYGSQEGVFMFASDVSALRCHPAFEGRLNAQAVAQQIKYARIGHGASIYEGIASLEPGCFLELTYTQNSLPCVVKTRYWSIENSNEYGEKHPISDEKEAKNLLQNTLENSVKDQMVADVPVGVFLSGGVDSSLIASMAQSQSSQPIHTFSIGFSEAKYNEAHQAKKIADYLGTKHTSCYVDRKTIQSVLPYLPECYSEPFSDVSQIPVFLVAKLASKHLKVALCGDGGDELFAGYRRHFICYWLNKKMHFLPPFLRLALSNVLQFMPAKMLGLALSCVSANFSPQGQVLNASFLCMLRRMLSCSVDLYDVILGRALWGNEKILHTSTSMPLMRKHSAVNQATELMNMDFYHYLGSDLLTKSDRACMFFSLEGRMPFLDKEVIGLAGRLPVSMKMDGRSGKRILREILMQYIPKDCIDQQKKGFSVALNEWLRGALFSWGEDIIRSKTAQEYINHSYAVHLWNKHQKGAGNFGYLLWNVLVLKQWLMHHHP